MQSTATDLQKQAVKDGLKINLDKTTEMRVNEKTCASIVPDTKSIESVQGFTYLGGHVSRDGGTLGDGDKRIQKAEVPFARLKNIWRSNRISLKTKIKIFNARVNNVLLYGCQTCMVTGVMKRKLQAYVVMRLRHILRTRWPRKICNVDLGVKLTK
jgi:hypothetical protein